MTDYRTELQKLVAAYDEHGGKWPDHHEQTLFAAVEHARTALAHPEPAGEVTDEELWNMYDQMSGEPGDWAWVRNYARAIIALDRSRRTPVQPAEGEVAELVEWMKGSAEDERLLCGGNNHRSEKLDRAAALLQHHQPPHPVAVGERLPELRQRFETTLNGARCLSDRPVGNVELADRLLDDVLAWHTPTTPPEAA